MPATTPRWPSPRAPARSCSRASGRKTRWPCLFVVSGEEAAERAAHALEAWLGKDVVLRYPERRDLPWKSDAPDDAVIGARTEAIGRLATGDACVVVASARSLLRRVPPVGSGYWASSTFAVGDEVPFEDVGPLLVGLGYADSGEVDGPGTFHIHGDAVDVFPAQAATPVRIEFFGDEIDRVRRMVASTGQTIGDLESVTVRPCRELALTDETVAHARKALWTAAQNDTKLAADLELIEARSSEPALERYLPALYGKTASPLEHVCADALMCFAEPRALFDDCVRGSDEAEQLARNAGVSTKGLFTAPRDMDFGSQQRLSFASMLRVGTQVTSELPIRQPGISGSDTRLLGRVRQLVGDGFSVLFAVPDRSAREHLELNFGDEHIMFGESLASAAENRVPLADPKANEPACAPALPRGQVTFIDAAVPAGIVAPTAKLAVLSVGDLSARMAKHRSRRRVDPTSITFPFKPGDYVVHATHGIALFADIVRQEVGGRERDYFLLEYAGGDKLFVPLEQVDRITRYVGPDGSSPRLTRLNTADWSRATNKARKNAKRLAFDLVDLYTRRASVQGHAFEPDTPEQEEMEASFPYELTADQRTAVNDIKADMETARPMDRLLCGDVGFGKTEVALRAAFKCVAEGRQVMVLCPTTILAQQHFETFFNRFAPFDFEVEVLSRFRTAKQQRLALEGFASGKVSVLVGTHRLLSSDVNPHDLGLVIVDEEQRFGVQHKEQLKNMREQVDVLTLSATPIPRTMQMAMSGVRDMSLIMTPPPGRLPVKVTVGEYDPDVVSAAIRTELARKGQVYYVSNRVKTIDEAEARVLEAAPEARVGVAHGKMSAKQVEDMMMKFQRGGIDVLVATTIIESGIDNPHTNTLIIEDSQRLGLAQLYQLKGRVGRGRTQAYAYFMFPGERPLTPEATERLTAINEFQVARQRHARGHARPRDSRGRLAHGRRAAPETSRAWALTCSPRCSGRPWPRPAAMPPTTSRRARSTSTCRPTSIWPRSTCPRWTAACSSTESSPVPWSSPRSMPCSTSARRALAPLPQAACNLFDRTRIRIRAQRLGVSSVSIASGRIIFQGLKCSRELTLKLEEQRALVYPKTEKEPPTRCAATRRVLWRKPSPSSSLPAETTTARSRAAPDRFSRCSAPPCKLRLWGCFLCKLRLPGCCGPILGPVPSPGTELAKPRLRADYVQT